MRCLELPRNLVFSTLTRCYWDWSAEYFAFYLLVYSMPKDRNVSPINDWPPLYDNPS